MVPKLQDVIISSVALKEDSTSKRIAEISSREIWLGSEKIGKLFCRDMLPDQIQRLENHYDWKHVIISSRFIVQGKLVSLNENV